MVFFVLQVERAGSDDGMQHDMDSEDSESCAGAVGGAVRGGDEDEEEEDFGYDDEYMFDPALDDDMFGEDVDLSKRCVREKEGGGGKELLVEEEGLSVHFYFS